MSAIKRKIIAIMNHTNEGFHTSFVRTFLTFKNFIFHVTPAISEATKAAASKTVKSIISNLSRSGLAKKSKDSRNTSKRSTSISPPVPHFILNVTSFLIITITIEQMTRHKERS